MLYGLFGVVIGMILGIILSEIVITILGQIIEEGKILFFGNTDIPLKMNFPIYLIILIMCITYIVVMISLLLPLRKIENINRTTGTKDTGKKKGQDNKVPTIIKKIFKQEGELAYKYTKREKSRHTALVSSITISVLLFLIANGIIQNFLAYSKGLNYNDYMIYIYQEEYKTEVVEEVIKYLEENDLIEGYYVQTNAFQRTPSLTDQNIKIPTSKVSETMIEILNAKGIYTNNESYTFVAIPYFVNNSAYNEILERAGINELKKNECIILNTQQVENSTYGDLIELTNYEVRR